MAFEVADVGSPKEFNVEASVIADHNGEKSIFTLNTLSEIVPASEIVLDEAEKSAVSEPASESALEKDKSEKENFLAIWIILALTICAIVTAIVSKHFSKKASGKTSGEDYKKIYRRG